MREALTFWCLIATALVLDARDYVRSRWRGTDGHGERIDPKVVDGCCGECDVCRPTVDA